MQLMPPSNPNFGGTRPPDPDGLTPVALINTLLLYVPIALRDAVDPFNATGFPKFVMFHIFICCTSVILQVFRMARHV